MARREAVGYIPIIGLCTAAGIAVGLGGFNAALAVLGLLAVSIAILWPLRALLVLVAYVPLEGFLLKWLPSESTAFLTLIPEILTLACVIPALTSRQSRLDHAAAVRWVALIAAFALVGAVSAYVNGVGWLEALYWIRTIVRYMPVALVVAAFVGMLTWTYQVAPLVAGGVILQAMFAVGQLVVGDRARLFFSPADILVGGTRYVAYGDAALSGNAGTLGFYNNFGLYCVLCFIVCAGSAYSLRAEENSRHRHKWTSPLVAAGSSAAILGVLISGSRQSLVALALAIVCLVALLGRRGLGVSWRSVAVVGSGIAAFAVVWPRIVNSLHWIPERFADAFSVSSINQSSATDRLFVVFSVVPAVLAEALLLGLGPGAVATAGSAAKIATSLDLGPGGLTFLQDVGWAGLLVQTGMLGCLVIAGAFIWVAGRARTAWVKGTLDRGVSSMVLTILVVVSAAMLASFPLLIRSVSFITWAAVGMVMGRQAKGRHA